MKLINAALILSFGVFAMACAQPEPEPAPIIVPEPTYDKYGNVVS